MWIGGEWMHFRTTGIVDRRRRRVKETGWMGSVEAGWDAASSAGSLEKVAEPAVTAVVKKINGSICSVLGFATTGDCTLD